MKIRAVGEEVSHEDRRADRHDETNSRFSQFSRPHLAKKAERAVSSKFVPSPAPEGRLFGSHVQAEAYY